MEQSKLPMIELHLHLDGAIPPKTMWALAQEKKIPMPAETLEGFRHWLVETSDCADVNTYLARFELPLQLMQDEKSIARVTKDLMTELSRQGHIYDEIRFAPQLHRREGLTQRQAIEAVVEGRRQALAENPGYDAGILLCAMCIGPETVNMAENLETVRLAKEFLGRGVVGADLAGAEGIVPLQSFHPVFDLARELGVPATCHAGDSQGPDTVRDALSFALIDMLSRYFSIHYSCTKCHTRYLFLFLSLSRFIHQVLERNTLRIIFWDLFPGTRFDRFLFRSFHSKRKLEEDNNRYKSEISGKNKNLRKFIPSYY